MSRIYKSIFLILLFINCKNLIIPDPYSDIEEKDSVNQNKPYLCIIWHPSPILEQKKFLTAYTISRLFFYRIENQTGTVKEILERNFKKYFSNQYQVLFLENPDCNEKVKIQIIENQGIWFPPQEFIQNPIPIRKGSLEISFIAKYTILDYTYVFQRKLKEFVLPNEEYQSTEKIYSFFYKEFIQDVEKNLKNHP